MSEEPNKVSDNEQQSAPQSPQISAPQSPESGSGKDLSEEPKDAQMDQSTEAAPESTLEHGEPGEELSKRLFVRPIQMDTSMEEVEKLFTQIGEVKEISLKPGYGFIEYQSAEHASEAIEKLNLNNSFGYEINIERAMARGTKRAREEQERPVKPQAKHRIELLDVREHFSWQDLKDLARTQQVEAVFTKVTMDGVGLIDVATTEDRDNVLKLNGTEWRGSVITVKENERGPPPPPRRDRFGGGRGRGDRRGRGGYRGGFRGDRDRGDRGDRYDRGRNDRYEGRDRYERRDRYDRDRSRSPRREW